MKDSVRLHVTGKTQQGKSYWVKNTLLPLLAKYKPVVVFDRKGEYAGERAKDIPTGAGWNHYQSIQSFFAALEKKGGTLSQSVHVITCRNDKDWNHGLRFFNALADAHLKTGVPVTLVIEEAHDLLQSTDFRETKKVLIQLARHGRHEGIGLVLISQRTLDVPTDIRSQLSGYVSFYQAYKGDIEALTSEGHPEAEKILELDPREYLAFGVIPKHLEKIKQGSK